MADKIECESCGAVMNASAVEDLDADQCPDCGEYTGFVRVHPDFLWGDDEDEDSDEDDEDDC